MADAPSLTVSGTRGNEDAAIPLSITTATTDVTGTEVISQVVISGVPSGAVLNHGTHNSDGTWTLSTSDLTGLTITPPSHSAADFTLTVTSTSHELGSDAAVANATTTSTLLVQVDALAHAPTLTHATAAAGNEDTRIGLNLSEALAPTVTNETLTLTLSGVTTGSAFYSASSGGAALGTDNHDGTWSFTSSEVATIQSGGIYLLPPQDWNDYNTTALAGMQLTATLSSATAADPNTGVVSTATTSTSFAVHVYGVADAPSLTVTPVAATNVGTSVALAIATATTDVANTEVISQVTIAGAPAGASFTDASGNPVGSYSGGVWTLTQAQLSGLHIVPPASQLTDFTLTVTSTSHELGSDAAIPNATTTATIGVAVDAQSGTAAAGNEDTVIALNLTPHINASAENLTMTIAEVPSGAHFYSNAAGTASIGTATLASDGTYTWSFSKADVAAASSAGFFIKPPQDWNDYNTTGLAGMQLAVTVTDASGSTAPITVPVHVYGVADAPTLTVTPVAATNVGTSVALAIATATTDVANTEVISQVTIAGAPAGASFTDASGNPVGSYSGGVWTLTQAQLSGLHIVPPASQLTDFTLTVTSTSHELGSDAAIPNATTTATIGVAVDAQSGTAAAGNEDTVIALNLTPHINASAENLTMTIAEVPSGAHFYSNAAGTASIGTATLASDGTYTWSFSKADVAAASSAGFFIKPPQDWNDYNTTGLAGMQLAVTVTDASGSTAPITVPVHVYGVADTPTVTASAAAGNEDTSIPLTITAATTDVTNTEVISAVTISGVPIGASFTDASGNPVGTNGGGGVWTLTQAQLTGLKIVPVAHSASDFTLTVTATSHELGSDAAIPNANATAQTLHVTLTGVAEAPVVGETTAAIGDEDTRINVNLSIAPPDPHEVITGITMTGVPSGSVFYATSDTTDTTKLGTYNSSTGTWSFTAAEVTTIQSSGHGLYVQPPLNWSDWNTIGNSALGMQLVTTVSVSETDPDTSKVSTNSTTTTIPVEVKSVADAPTVTATSAHGNEDAAISLSIAPHLTDTDGSESITALTITGVPSGAVLNHGHLNSDGSYTLTTADLTGLTITPPAYSKTAFTLYVTATSTEAAVVAAGSADSHVDVWSATSAPVAIPVTVAAVADPPNLTVHDSQGLQDQWVSLSIAATTPDTSGTEIVSVTITGMPSGAILNHGTYDSTSQTWTVSQSDLSSLKVLPLADSNADFTLEVTAHTLEPSDNSTNLSATMPVHVVVTEVAEAPNFTETAQARGLEDTRIDLNLSGSLTDSHEALTLALTGIPSNAHFYASSDTADSTALGTYSVINGVGTWTFSTDEVASFTATGHNLYLQPPTNWSDWNTQGLTSSSDWSLFAPGQGGFKVAATLTSTNTDVDSPHNTDAAATTINFTVHVTGVADPSTVQAGDFVATAQEDNGNTRSGALVDLGFGSLALTDTDGSEHLSVVVSNLPANTQLVMVNGVSADNIVPIGNGKYSIQEQYLSSLRLEVPNNFNTVENGGILTMTAAVVTTEVDGNFRVDTRNVDITVTPVTDSANISGGNHGYEGASSIPLDLSVSAGGISETINSITLDFTAGTALGAQLLYNGSAVTLDSAHHLTLSADQMANLSGFSVVAPNSNWSDWSDGGTGILVGVSVVTQDHTAAALTTNSTLAVHVAGVADAPTLTAFTSVSIGPGAPTYTSSAPLNLASHAALTDTDGSERLWFAIDGVPDGALLVNSSGALAGYSEGHGHWLISADQWAAEMAGDISIVIPNSLNGVTSATVTVTAYSTEQDDGSTAATTTPQSFALNWVGTGGSGGGGTYVAPTAPSVTASASGNEDNAIPLNIVIGAHASTLVPTLTIDASSIPSGATLSAGFYDSADNVWLVSGDSAIAGLKITPPANWNSDLGTLSLSGHVAFTDTVGGGTATVDQAITVQVNPVTDTASVSGGATGLEDTKIGLNLQIAPGGIQETLVSATLDLSGAPTGTTLYYNGTAVAMTTDGSGHPVHVLSAAELADPSKFSVQGPLNWSDYSGSMTIGVTATTQDHDATPLTTTQSIAVDIKGVTDPAILTVTTTNSDGSSHVTTNQNADGTVNEVTHLATTGTINGTENQWIDLSTHLNAALYDTDGSEGISIVLAGMPSGAVLNHGYNNGDGTWTLQAGDMSSLQLLMPTDYNGRTTMTLEALTWEKDGSSPMVTTSADFTVTIGAVAETPSLSVTSAEGKEDTAIALTIGSSVTHALGTDHIDYITITGAPSGAVLSAGTHNADGSWTLTQDQLTGLTITPPHYSDATMTLQVTATASETDSISGAVSTATSSAIALVVKVDAVADGGSVVVANASGNENAWISLANKITPSLIDTDGSESITGIVISGVPDGALLNHGVHNSDGTWTVSPSDLGTLAVMPTANSAADFTLSAAVTTTEAANGDTKTGVAASFGVTVAAVAAPLTLTQTAAAEGNQDSRIAINLSSVTTDPHEVTTLTISGVPTGSHFYDAASGGVAIGTDNGNGTWSFTSSELAETQQTGNGLYVLPPTYWSDWSSTNHSTGMQLTATVTGTTTDPDANAVNPVSTTTASLSFAVHVDAVAVAPTVSVGTVQGSEDSVIQLNNIVAALTDTTGSQYISAVTIGGVPNGVVLNHGVNNNDGTWTLQPADLSGLTITPLTHSAQDIDLTVTATSQDWANSSSATSTAIPLVVEVAPLAHLPTLTQSTAASGNENGIINLHLSEALASGVTNETLGMTISGVQTGSHFYADSLGADPIGTDNHNGTWTFSATDISLMQASGHGVYFQAPANWSDYASSGHNTGMQLSATLTSTATDPEGIFSPSVATSTQSFTLHVLGVADTPTVTTQAAIGNEDSPIALSIGATLPMSDGSEVVSAITLTGVPTGATLNHGTHNSDGSWTLTASQLSGLTITAPSHSAADFTLEVTATSTEQGSDIASGLGTATSAQTALHVEVDPTAHAPTLTYTAAGVTGDENTLINLNLSEALATGVSNETLGMTISGVQPNSHFYDAASGGVAIGTDNGNGTWTFSSADIALMQASGHGVYLQAPTNWSDDNSTNHDSGMSLTVSLNSTASDPDSSATSTATTTGSFAVHVAQPPTLSTGDDIAAVGDALHLELQGATAASDGSETLSLTISGLPSGVSFSDGNYNATTHTWTGTEADAANVTVTGLAAGIFTLAVTATSTEANGVNTSTTSSITADILSSSAGQNVASLDSSGHLLTFGSLANLPNPPTHDVLGEFVFGSLNGVHDVSVANLNATGHGELKFTDSTGAVILDIAANSTEHGTIDSSGVHLNGVASTTDYATATHVTVNLSVGNETIHLNGVDQIAF